MKLKFMFLIGLGAATALSDPPGIGEREAAYRVVTRWNAGDCEGSRRKPWDNMVDAWYDAITTGHGEDRNWQRSGYQRNENIQDADFADSGLKYWGRDFQNTKLDGADAFMAGLHGAEQGPELRWRGRVRIDGGSADPDDDCNALQDDILLDFDAEFVHLSSCHSMCDDNRARWSSSYAHVHLITGFHGPMVVRSALVDDYEDFGDDAFEMAIATAWLDELYKRRIPYRCVAKVFGICTAQFHTQQCPVAQAAGTGPYPANVADARNHRDTEQYDDVLSHPAPRTARAWTWISGCNPSGSDPAQP